MMKTLVIIFSVVGLMTLNSCKQETNVQAMLENTETRSEIMKAIADDHNLMTEFMGNMQGNEHAMQMMQGNKEMMGNMMMGEGKQMMMSEMMGNGEMMGTMMNMMHEKGLMSDECMKSCMEMMNNKEMNMDNMHN